MRVFDPTITIEDAKILGHEIYVLADDFKFETTKIDEVADRLAISFDFSFPIT